MVKIDWKPDTNVIVRDRFEQGVKAQYEDDGVGGEFLAVYDDKNRLIFGINRTRIISFEAE